MIVAIFLISNLFQLFRAKQQKSEAKKYPKYILAIIGFLAGFVSGITGAIGLLFNRFYLKLGLKKEEIVATRAANEVFLHFIKLLIYFSLGLFSKSAIYLGVIIAFATIISSLSIKFILPLISEHLFKKIGFAAMVISGFTLFWTASTKIIDQDNLRITSSKDEHKNYSTLTWRNSTVTFEYALNYGFEIEHHIKPHQLPQYALNKYHKINGQYDKIILEKVYSLGKKPSYEFNCYKNNQLTKIKV